MGLHQQFVQLGKSKNDLENQLCALLPEIYKQGIYKEHFPDIYEYARYFGGLSNTKIDLALKLEKKLANLPILKAKISKVGVYKVNLVASLATAENEQMLAESVEMPKSKVKQLSKDMRREKKMEMFGEVDEEIRISLDNEMQFLFNKLKKELGENLSNKEALRKILETYATPQTPRNSKSVSGHRLGKSTSRTIPAHTKREAIGKTNGKCAYPNCVNPYDVLHHRDRFAKSGSHESIVPLCSDHHEIAHNGLIENERQSPENWKIRLRRELDEIDRLFLKYKAGKPCS